MLVTAGPRPIGRPPGVRAGRRCSSQWSGTPPATASSGRRAALHRVPVRGRTGAVRRHRGQGGRHRLGLARGTARRLPRGTRRSARRGPARRRRQRIRAAFPARRGRRGFGCAIPYRNHRRPLIRSIREGTHPHRKGPCRKVRPALERSVPISKGLRRYGKGMPFRFRCGHAYGPRDWIFRGPGPPSSPAQTRGGAGNASGRRAEKTVRRVVLRCRWSAPRRDPGPHR